MTIYFLKWSVQSDAGFPARPDSSKIQYIIWFQPLQQLPLQKRAAEAEQVLYWIIEFFCENFFCVDRPHLGLVRLI
jgi:hypothetical protein